VVWAVIAAGVLLTAGTWLGRDRVSLWWSTAVVFGVLGLVSLVIGPVSWSPKLSPALAAAAGLAAGVGVYVGTLVFVSVVVRWPVFRRHVAEIYHQRRGVSLGTALALVVLVVAPGEEIFWRGLVQARAAEATTPAMAAVITWAAYVAANAASRSLPIVAGAVVGGAVWGALAWWTGGVLASVLCHAAWTGLMILRPPREAGG
jgi:membrane protease YdiL (CAAX protease family)